MNSLSKLAEKLRAHRLLIATAVVIGLAATGVLIALVPSQLGFAMAGPLVVFPWGLLCIAFARQPSAAVVAFFAAFSLCGFAWLLLYV